jgi:hypothetical protein
VSDAIIFTASSPSSKMNVAIRILLRLANNTGRGALNCAGVVRAITLLVIIIIPTTAKSVSIS